MIMEDNPNMDMKSEEKPSDPPVTECADGQETQLYRKLTPTDMVDENTMEGYNGVLDIVFAEDDLRNVAVTGPYGSGKTSVLKTYMNHHNKDLRLYNVSLAHFPKAVANERSVENNTGTGKRGVAQVGGEDEPGGETKVGEKCRPTPASDSPSENTIEGKILNQLVQQIPPERIPDSNFHVKHGVNAKFCRRVAIWTAVAVFLVVLVCLLGSNSWADWITGDGSTHPVMRFVFFGLQCLFSLGFVAILGYGAYGLVRLFRAGKLFGRISHNGIEAEIFSDEKDPYFDRYLNELLYLLENAGADAIVFEDIDRFDDGTVFERLREINTLANERIDLYNEELKKDKGNKRKHKDGQKNEEGLEERRHVKFLYLMRDDLFPAKDRTKFFDLTVPVVPVVDGSNSYNTMRGYLDDAGIGAGDVDDGFLRDMCVFIDDMRILKSTFNEFMVYDKLLSGTRESNPAFTRKKLLAMCAYKNVFPVDYANLQLRRGYVNSVLNPSADSEGDEGDCGKVVDLSVEGLKTALEKLNKSEREDDRKSYGEIHGNYYYGLLRFLLINKYIGDDFYIYMSYSPKGGLNAADTEFVRNVLSGTDKNYERHLSDCKAVLNYLEREQFAKPEALNFDLADFALKHDETEDYALEQKKTEYTEMVEKQIYSGKKLDFFLPYYKHPRENRPDLPGNLVATFNKLDTGFFSLLLESEDDEARGTMYSYSLYSLCMNDDSVLDGMDGGDGRLSAYVSSVPDYLKTEVTEKMDGDMRSALLGKLERLGVKFKNVDSGAVGSEMTKEICDRCIYEKNKENLDLFIHSEYAEMDGEDGECRVLTIMEKHSGETLTEYYGDVGDIVLEYAVESGRDGIRDDERIAADTLGNGNLKKELRLKYAEMSVTVIDDVSAISDEDIFRELFKNKTFGHTAANALRYYGVCGFTDDLAGFIDSSDAMVYSGEPGWEQAEDGFVDGAAKCGNLSAEKFKGIVSQYDGHVKPGPEIASDKFQVILSAGKISMDLANLDFIRAEYPDALMEYVCGHFDEYVNLKGNVIQQDEMEEVLSWSEIPAEKRVSLMRKMPSVKVSVFRHEYPDEILGEIIKANGSHLVSDEIPEIYERYDEFSEATRKKILAMAKIKVSDIIQNKWQISHTLLFDLEGQIQNMRIALAKTQIGSLTPDEVDRLLCSMGASEIKDVLATGGDLTYSQYRRDVLSMLKEVGLIAGYKVDSAGRKIAVSPKKQSDT